jgi:hypothetical protein
MIVAGCSTSAERQPLARQLPPPPAFAEPVVVADPRTGESAVAVAARERAGRVAANSRLRAFVVWYEGVKKDFAR